MVATNLSLHRGRHVDGATGSITHGCNDLDEVHRHLPKQDRRLLFRNPDAPRRQCEAADSVGLEETLMRLLRSSSRSIRALLARPASVAAAGALAGVLLAQPAQAQTPDPMTFFSKIEFSGLVDTYYTYNFNEPTDRHVHAAAELRREAQPVQRRAGRIRADASRRPTTIASGFRFDLQYGQVAQIFNGDPLDNNALLNVQQAYVSYLAPVGNGLTFDVGKFVTPIGTEPTESKTNNNYSRAFLYALGPYYHVGARLGYTINDKVTLGGMLVNGWNATGDNNSGKTVGGSITIKPADASSRSSRTSCSARSRPTTPTTCGPTRTPTWRSRSPTR